MFYKKYISYFVLVVVSLVFAYLNHWQLFEQDAFWLTRAGDEILKSLSVQTVDTWSFSVKGQEWINFQWLTCVLFSLVVKWGGHITALVWLRSVLSFLFFMICGTLILRSMYNLRSSGQQAIGALAILILAPCIYFTSWLRFQIRPDFLGIILFAVILYIANFKLFVSAKTEKISSPDKISELKKIISCKYFVATLALLILWSNFHAGTVVLGIFFLALALFVHLDVHFKYKFLLTGIFALTWFATPQHWHVIKVMLAATQVYNNPDLQPFQFKNFLFKNGGYTYIIFWIYWVISVGAYIFSAQVRQRLSELYQSKIFFCLLTGAFTILFLQRQRTIPYITLCLLPVAASYFAIFSEQSLLLARVSVRQLFNLDFHLTEMRWRHYRSWLICLSAIGAAWFVMLPVQKNINVEIGRKVSSQFMPVKSVEFIDYARPNLNLYNYFSFGGYVIYMLHDYPVFYDGRETPFLEVGRERDLAARDPRTFSTFLKKYNINTVLEALPQGDMVKVYSEYYQPEEWARVYSDVVSTVYVRRIPDHEYLISHYEKDGAKVQIDTSGTASSAGTINRPPKPTEQEIQKLLRSTQEQLQKEEKLKGSSESDSPKGQ